MKKSTIWIVAGVMGFAFIGLLFLQISYIEEMAKMKKEQFDESVNRALYQASRNLEMNETLRYLEKDVNDVERRAYTQDSVVVNSLDGSILVAECVDELLSGEALAGLALEEVLDLNGKLGLGHDLLLVL